VAVLAVLADGSGVSTHHNLVTHNIFTKMLDLIGAKGLGSTILLAELLRGCRKDRDNMTYPLHTCYLNLSFPIFPQRI
jgi:hypothetical protein